MIETGGTELEKLATVSFRATESMTRNGDLKQGARLPPLSKSILLSKYTYLGFQNR